MPNQKLLVKESFFKNGKNIRQEQIKQLSVLQPNTKLLGIPLKLHVYNLAKEKPDSLFDLWLNKKPKRADRLNKLYSKKQVLQLKKYKRDFSSWLKKSGEAPAIFSENNITTTSDKLTQYYKNIGFFNTTIETKVNELTPKKVSVDYLVETGEAFTIDEKTSTIASNDLDSIYKNHISESFLLKDNVFRVQDFEKERARLVALFRDNGIENFQQKSIRFKVYLDSLGTDYKIPVKVEVMNEVRRAGDSIIEVPYVIQKVKKINLYIKDSSSEDFSIYTDTLNYEGITIFSDGKLNYKPKSLASGIFIKEGMPYSDKDRLATYKYFSELQVFKYPNINFITDEQNPLELVSSIYLTPRKPFSIGFDLDLTHSNIQDIGITLGSSIISRNVFKGTEILEFSFKSAFGASEDLGNTSDTFFNIFEIGSNLNLKIPRIIFPLNRPVFKDYFEKGITNISIGTSSQRNVGLDKQNFTGVIEYNWTKKEIYNFSFKLVDLEFVNNLAISNYFNVYKNSYDRLNEIAKSIDYQSSFLSPDNDLIIPSGATEFITNVLEGNTILSPETDSYQSVRVIQERENRLTSNNFILGSSFSFSRNNQENIFDEDFSHLKFKIETNGNLLVGFLNLLGANENDSRKVKLLDLVPSQFVKTEFNYIKHWSVRKDDVVAFRFFSGIAIPYGNSDNIPFIRSYYAGGANDNRAWQAYKLGPGIGESTNEFNEANLKLALNLEYRYPIFGKLNGAFFIDAGNIWNVLDNIENPKQRFEGINDLDEIAIGSGFGLRYDFNYFIFRLDTAFKTYDPSEIKSRRWWKQVSLDRAVLNIGINYPF